MELREANALTHEFNRLREAKELAILSYRYSPAERYSARIRDTDEQINESIDRFREFSATDYETGLLERLVDSHNGVIAIQSRLLEAARDGNNEKVAQDFQLSNIASRHVDATLADFSEYYLKKMKLITDNAKRNTELFSITIILFMISIFIAGVAIYFYYNKTIINPIGRLTARARQIAGGDLGQTFKESERNDEVGSLAQAFGTMAAGLIDANKKLEEELDKQAGELSRSNTSLEHLNYALEKLSAGFSLWDKDDRFVTCNAFFRKYRSEVAKLLKPGLRHEEYVEEVLKGTGIVLDEAGKEEWLQRHRERRSAKYREHEDVQSDGRVFRVTTEKLDDGSTISFHFDITENANFREDLKRSNTDLEQFAYVASHDLQEPLRMVASYTELLAKRYEGQLDERADKYIGHAVSGAKRMQSLLNDLLAYSRAGQTDKSHTPTETMKIVDNVVGNLSSAIERTGAEIRYRDLPAVMSEPAQLSQIFQNLIGNAIKFHGEESPKIKIAAKSSGTEWMFFVSDNGIGIDANHFDRIFTIFQRLHERGTYEGTGLGLAIVKKLIERHGGRIAVESEPGQGTTFIFTLPKATIPLGESL